MNFENLVNKVSNLSCFTVRFLAAGQNLPQVRLQISRWVRDGRLIKLHKGLYVLAEAYRKITPEKFCVANQLKSASYISLQSALSFYGLIPEYVPQISSVTTGRPQTIETPLGRFDFRNISKKFFYGFKRIELAAGQNAFIACPEKALLDLVHLSPGSDSEEFIEQLRLQNFDKINKNVLFEFADKADTPKLKRACKYIEKIIQQGEGIEL
ncbi:MAG: type IV toxin-antitoxin system AbiEi family antitoxin domain-containing protein [Phycisphaerae bacterium]|jgi:predicted transcriptional regulator of viral defense system